MQYIKKHWELVFLFVINVLIPIVIQILMKQKLDIIFYTLGIINFISYYLVLKKNIQGLYLYIICLFISIYIDFNAKIYGDLLLRLFYILPIQIIVIYKHFQHRTENNKISYTSWKNMKEMVITTIITLSMIAIITFNLNIINKIPGLNLLFKENDPYILLDAVSVVCNIMAQYLFSKRNYNWFLINIFADLPLMIIWMFEFMNGNNSGALVLVFGNLSYAFISSLGYIRELKEHQASTKDINFEIVDNIENIEQI